MDTDSARPAVTELRLSAFKTHRNVTLPLGPLTLLSGESGSGKSSALQAYEILARLGSGERLARAVEVVAGGASACVPASARPDEQGRRGFRIGCTVDGPAGLVHLDLAVQAEPELRIVGERLTGGGETLLSTALTDPARPAVQAAWHTAGATPVTRAPLPDDRLGTALLPLRVAGKTAGQRLVLAAAEQVVVALRSAFPCDPRPEAMRAAGTVRAGGDGALGRQAVDGAGGDSGAGGPGAVRRPGGRRSGGPLAGARGGAGVRRRASGRSGELGGWAGEGDEEPDEGRLRSSCDNLPAVLERTSRECARRHAVLVAAVRDACAGPVDGLRAVPRQPGAVGDGAGAAARPGAGPEVAGRGAPPGTQGTQGTPGGPGAPDARTAPTGRALRTAQGAQGAQGARAVQALSGAEAVQAPHGLQAVLDRGALGVMPVEQLGDGELRFLGLALVLLTGPGVLAMDPVGEIPAAQQQLTVMADGMDRCMDRRQARELVSLAVRMAERGHVRLLGTVRDPSVAEGLPGVRVLHLGA
ncbi:biotin transporter BioY [Streptomyces celluloflavus]|uniref:biotin transporter BioY n=1 Tax=Streptomyces celluloflavus TaxID=58344 RepID=UPI00345F8565|nr:biotin transporter BioY [Streptomyces celluloflavus]